MIAKGICAFLLTLLLPTVALASQASYLGSLPITNALEAEFFTLLGNYYCVAANKYGHNDQARKATASYARKLDPTGSEKSAWDVAGLVQKKAKTHLCP